MSAFVKNHLPQTLINLHSYQSKKYSQALIEAFESVDKMMLTTEGEEELNSFRKDKKNHSSPALLCGCTGNVLLITEDKIYSANCGDSRAAILVENDK